MLKNIPWPPHPLIYEINTWVWLQHLSRVYERPLTLAQVPPAEWDALAFWGFQAVWLMGVWERSPAGLAIALENPNFQAEYDAVLPDWTPADVVGSPYCVRDYRVDERLGGPGGLAAAREQLSQRGLRLLLDFVPNHVAPDHPWVAHHPEYLIQGGLADLKSDPTSFFHSGEHFFARGRDPFFPPWPDVIQVNAFQPGLRRAAVETLEIIGDQCDGVRCDMAMLMLNRVFQNTWGSRAGVLPGEDFWVEVISQVRQRHPRFLFLAEAYWDLEGELLGQGFDYCYDKRLYDRLRHETAETVRLHLQADLNYQRHLVRFIENHDEPRAAGVFGRERSRAAAVITATLPGARLFHQGQFEGRRLKVPVMLGRGPEEERDAALEGFYRNLLQAVNEEIFHLGQWHLCPVQGWPDNPSFRNLLAYGWRAEGKYRLIVVNLASVPSQGRIQPGWPELAGRTCRWHDVFRRETYERLGDELLDPGLFVALEPWEFHLLAVSS